ncbi:hypothetical protein [Sinomonas sp. RB5]
MGAKSSDYWGGSAEAEYVNRAGTQGRVLAFEPEPGLFRGERGRQVFDEEIDVGQLVRSGSTAHGFR